jgi:uncharacterized membrane protein YhhN
VKLIHSKKEVDMSIPILTCITIFSAFLTICAKYNGQVIQVYIFKPLTTALILLIAWLGDKSFSTAYQYLILLGLLFSLSGDVFLMLPKDRFILGLISFLITHLFYISAFTNGMGFILTGWIVLAVLLMGIVTAVLLVPHAGRMKLPVVFYITVILVMTWQAWERWNRMRTRNTLLAAAGALLFLFSDSLLAWNRFRRSFKNAEALKLGSYFAGQWMIAISVGQ